jgi:hypothetical protein
MIEEVKGNPNIKLFEQRTKKRDVLGIVLFTDAG